MRRRSTPGHQFLSEGLLSIGALSAATGVPVETIRTWERRYGVPVAERKRSGHRIYPLSTVPHLRRIAQAIARGHRASEVVRAPEGILTSLLDSMSNFRDGVVPHHFVAAPDPAAIGDEAAPLGAVRAFDADRLKRIFQAEWAGRGPLEFLERKATPFLKAVGTAWAEGTLDVRHEHFASAVLGDFLRTVRMPLDDRATGPTVALATLPGEKHGLGLQMSALVFALAGWRCVVLGIDTPVEQIVALAREAPVAAVALSCIAPRSRTGARSLQSLRRRLPRHVALLIGGANAPAPSRRRGIEIMPDLSSLERWLRTRPPFGS